MKRPGLFNGVLYQFQNQTYFLTFVTLCGCYFGDVGFSAETNVATSPLPKVFCADPQALAGAKTKFIAGDPSFKPAFDKLFTDARKALKVKPPSVMDKRKTPPSGDKHDFVSQAPYYWPDTNSPDGPYVRKDGERNPESMVDSDAARFETVCSSAHTLALAFYFTGEKKYAKHAARLVRVWFLNPATRMNPNLNFGQGVPGKTAGRASGIIGTHNIVELADALVLLANSKYWTAKDQTAMTAWAGEYLQWLTTSKLGRAEGKASNYHGTFYDAQVTALALFVGNTTLAREILESAQHERIAKQIDPDGSQPRELHRATSFNYCVFNLTAMLDLASLGQNAGVDLWHFATDDGRGIRKALEFMAAYADPARQWSWQQIKEPDRSSLGELLLRAAAVYPEGKFEEALKFFDAKELAASRSRLLFNTAKMAAQPDGDLRDRRARTPPAH